MFDGTSTDIVANIKNPGSSEPVGLYVYNNKLFFSADDGVVGKELWYYDGINPASLAADIHPSNGSDPAFSAEMNDKLYGSADDGTYGREIWVYEPTVEKEMFYSQAAYDGWIRESGETTGRGGTLNTSWLACQIGDDPFNRQYRSILHFNTSRIPDTAIVVRVTLQYKQHSIIGSDPYSTHGAVWADIRKGFYSGSPALQLSDFAAASTMNFAGRFSEITSPFPYRMYRTQLKRSAQQHINLTGITQFRLRFGIDDDNDNTADFAKIFCGDMGVPFNRPVLRVWYYVP
jgi:ELWxxDGT repeat protein